MMKRRLFLLISAVFVSTALVGAGTAFAHSHGIPYDGIHEDCDNDGRHLNFGLEDDYTNDAVIYDFSIDSVDGHRALKPSGIEGSALACGSEAKALGGGKQSFYEEATVDVAPGVVVSPTNETSDWGRYAGDGEMDAIGHLLTTRQEYYDMSFKVKVGRRDPNPKEGCYPDAIACYYGESSIGFNWNSVVDEGGQLKMKIQWVNGLGGFDPGLAKIDMNLCKNFGAVDGTECGGINDPVIQYNGDSSYPNNGCVLGNGPNGRYEVGARQRGGTEALPDESCVTWLSGLKDYRKFLFTG